MGVQRIWKGYLGRLCALRTASARHRRHLACRRLLRHWRRAVCARFLQPMSAFDTSSFASPSGSVEPLSEHTFSTRLLDATHGEVIAVSMALQELKAKNAEQLLAVRSEHARLLE